MKLRVTGLNGALAPQLARTAQAAGRELVGWDRATVPPEDANRPQGSTVQIQ